MLTVTIYSVSGLKKQNLLSRFAHLTHDLLTVTQDVPKHTVSVSEKKPEPFGVDVSVSTNRLLLIHGDPLLRSKHTKFCFNVVTTFLTSKRRCINVKTTSCAYWVYPVLCESQFWALEFIWISMISEITVHRNGNNEKKLINLHWDFQEVSFFSLSMNNIIP